MRVYQGIDCEEYKKIARKVKTIKSSENRMKGERKVREEGSVGRTKEREDKKIISEANRKEGNVYINR